MTGRAAPDGGVGFYADPMTEPTAVDCLFCSMVAGELQPDVVHETDTTLAFRDINPQAPTHVLVVPKAHHRDVAALAAADSGLVSDLLGAVAAVVEQEGIQGRFRLVCNTGAEAGQTVFH